MYWATFCSPAPPLPQQMGMMIATKAFSVQYAYAVHIQNLSLCTVYVVLKQTTATQMTTSENIPCKELTSPLCQSMVIPMQKDPVITDSSPLPNPYRNDKLPQTSYKSQICPPPPKTSLVTPSDTHGDRANRVMWGWGKGGQQAATQLFIIHYFTFNLLPKLFSSIYKTSVAKAYITQQSKARL